MKRIAILAISAALACTAGMASAQARSTATSAATTVSGLDKEFLTTSMQGDLFEVQGGKIAERLSRNAAVLKLARTLVSDHTKSFDDTAKIARRLGVKVPSQPTQSQIWELKIVSTLRGRAFNHWYSMLEAYDHVQDISETTGEVQDGTNADVIKDAKQEIPMLQMHLMLSREALKANP